MPTVRLTSNEAISFDVSAELIGSTRNALRAEVIDHFKEYIDHMLSNDERVRGFMDAFAEQMQDEWGSLRFAENVAQRVNYPYLVDALRNEFVRQLLDDERFRSRMMRAISDATIGVTDEVVERVVATLDGRNNPQADA